MKVLITLRHPGPLQAIVAILPELRNTFSEVMLVITDVALEIAQSRFEKQIEGLAIYYFDRDQWKKTIVGGAKKIFQSGITEFDDIAEKGFRQMVNDIKEIIEKENPDIILRTTPAMKYGVDEAVCRAAAEEDIMDRMRCYQEIYGCGIDLKELKTPVGVVDVKAAKKLRDQGISSFVIGWMNQAVFEKYDSYETVRTRTRAQLGLRDTDRAILYCTVASGNSQSELGHFWHFLEQMLSSCARAYICFHPRNTDEYQKQFLNLAKVAGVKISVTNHLSMEQRLAFSDFIISAGSAINLDLLQYQLLSGVKQLKTLSIYTRDKETRSVLHTAFGIEIPPYMEMGMGSLILDGTEYITQIDHISDVVKKQLYEDAKEMFGIPLTKVKERFLMYLFDNMKLGKIDENIYNC